MQTDVRARTTSPGATIDPNVDVRGYGVEATDGPVGKVDEATYDAGSGYLVVDTGPWIFGKTVMLPAAVIRSIDETGELVFLDCTKDEVKHAPELDGAQISDGS
jgi:hypothetical protein